MKRVLSLLFVLCLMVLGACSQQSSNNENEEPKDSDVKTSEKLMKLAVVTSEDRSLTKGLVKFGELVESKTNGSIKVEVYPNGQLGGDREVFESLQFGSIQGTTMSTGPIAQFVPKFNVFDLPFLFPNSEVAYGVLDGKIGTDLLAELESQNVIGLNYWENGFRHLTNGVKEVKTPDDVKGLKIRTLENDLHMDIWSELGANPTPMAFTELFAGLQQGVVDGQENPVGNVTANKFYEVQKYLSKTGHVYNASPFLISKDFWNSLSDEEKKAVQEAADEARDYQRELNQKEDEDGYKFLTENGMTVTDISDEEKEAFLEKVKPVYEKYSASIGEEFVDQLLAEINNLKK
ncbi:TRAP transporter substrate-binding protein [Robertmurraya korlensis]|uniref:TRAP transporter substrate-binding protein n=1 Tax=Robertmurraya korlensis TaxID=519977 RepID=UPI00203E710C|nr:TRAP transporter substrate-binding protein [Robertmurraya korlensis]MCM3601623.1 TRAP transporter substrate-binding protein [Robertmurraya korlensis]